MAVFQQLLMCKTNASVVEYVTLDDFIRCRMLGFVIVAMINLTPYISGFV